jgi:hypothetical protein
MNPDIICVLSHKSFLCPLLCFCLLVGVGVMINISIQRAQIAASEANAGAEIGAAKNLNTAELAVTEGNAELQRDLQEGTLAIASQTAEHLSEICALPVACTVHYVAHLYLLAPNALLPEGLRILRAWGCDYAHLGNVGFK